MACQSHHSLSPWSRRLVRGALLVLAAGGVVLLFAVPPTDDSFYPRCHFHTLTGLHCPGCGTTRALHAVLHGQVAQALAYNPLVLIVLPILGWSLIQFMKSGRRGILPAPQGRWSRIFLNLLLVIILLFWICRNIPVYPLTLLAPHEI